MKSQNNTYKLSDTGSSKFASSVSLWAEITEFLYSRGHQHGAWDLVAPLVYLRCLWGYFVKIKPVNKRVKIVLLLCFLHQLHQQYLNPMTMARRVSTTVCPRTDHHYTVSNKWLFLLLSVHEVALNWPLVSMPMEVGKKEINKMVKYVIL